jgi:hypothetical protein
MIPALVELVVVLIVAGLVLWLVQQFLPIPVGLKNLIYVVIVLILILYLLRIFGILRV